MAKELAAPDGLEAHVASCYAPFCALSPRHRTNIAQMLWDICGVRYLSEDGGGAFSVQYMQKLWGNLKTRNRVLPEYFCVIQGGVLSGKASRYIPYEFLVPAVMGFLQSPIPIELRYTDGTKLKLLDKPISSRVVRKDGMGTKHSAWQGCVVANAVPINEESLLRFHDLTTNLRHRLSALRLIRLSHNSLCPGYVPVRYEQKSTGRICETNFFLQNTEREVLSAALAGHYDYDIQNAHFSIFQGLAHRLNLQTPHTEYYNRNRSALRAELSSHCQTDQRSIKMALIAPLYGAGLKGNIQRAVETPVSCPPGD